MVRFRFGAALASLMLLLVACNSDTDSTAGDTAAAPDVSGEVVVLTHDSFDVSSEVIDLFESTTGVTVRLVPLGDAGTALNQAILTADAPQGDILFGVDNTFLTRALAADLFTPYLPENFGVLNPQVLDDLRDATGSDFTAENPPPVVPVTYGDVCVNYDRAWFEANDLAVPTSFGDLIDPAYRGLLTIMNPATSSPGLAFMLATVTAADGAENYEAYWQALAENDVLITNGWSEAYYDEFSHTGQGDRPLVVSYASSPPAEVLFAETPLDEAPTGVILDTCFRQVEFAGILNGAPNRAAAELFLTFMLDVPFQEDIPLTMFVFPVNTQATLPEVFAEHAVVPENPRRFGLLDDSTRDVLIAEWSTIMLG